VLAEAADAAEAPTRDSCSFLCFEAGEVVGVRMWKSLTDVLQLRVAMDECGDLTLLYGYSSLTEPNPSPDLPHRPVRILSRLFGTLSRDT
jgi:hypothetical protein